MTYLLDTNVVSELRKSADRTAPGVRAWARSKRTSELWLSVITIMEVEISVGRVERRDRRQGLTSPRWLELDLLPLLERGMTVVTRKVSDFTALDVDLVDP